MESAASSPHMMARKPLTERPPQGWAQHQSRKVAASHKRVYGKRGIASSRAVLSDQFLDENEIEHATGKGIENENENENELGHQILKKMTEQAITLPAPPAPPPESCFSQDDAKTVAPAHLARKAQKSCKSQHGLVSNPLALLTLSRSALRWSSN
jgi:hypothetical protein